MNISKYHDILKRFGNPLLIKQGGQKSVFRISHSKFGDTVLKVGSYQSTNSLERIRREVMVLQEIDSSYYPKVYQFEVVSYDQYFIIEEYIDSMPLSECMERFVSPYSALSLIKNLTQGLALLWNRNIVHRDVKPDNILIQKDLTPKIIDLGIARLLDLESLTQTILARGPATPIYAAPEQLTNRKTIIDLRTDQFNLGIILAQLLLDGNHPYDPRLVGSGETIMQNIILNYWYDDFLEDKPYRLIAPLLRRLLKPEPYQRYRLPILLLTAIDEVMKELK